LDPDFLPFPKLSSSSYIAAVATAHATQSTNLILDLSSLHTALFLKQQYTKTRYACDSPSWEPSTAGKGGRHAITRLGLAQSRALLDSMSGHYSVERK
jgi:hypothetical protein